MIKRQIADELKVSIVDGDSSYIVRLNKEAFLYITQNRMHCVLFESFYRAGN